MAYPSLTRPITLALTLTACGATPGTSEGGSESTSEASTDAAETGATTDDTSGTTNDPTGTGEAGTTVDLPGVHFKQDIWPIFQPNCYCHVMPPDGMTPGVAAYPTFGEDPHGAYLVLVDQPSTVTGLDYIEPGDSAGSYLFHKVSGTQAEVNGGGDPMPPYPGPMLSADQLATIKEWIDTGAAE